MKSEPWINKSIVQIQMGQIPTINRSERRMIIDKLLSQLQYHLFPGKSLKTLEIFDTAAKENISTHKAALLLAESRIKDIARLKSIR